MIFNINKPVDVKYIIDIPRITQHFAPVSLYKNIEPLETEKKTGCPAAKSAEKRIFHAYPPFTIEVEFGLNGIGDTFINWNYDKKDFPDNSYNKNLINSLMNVFNHNNKFVDLQMMLPYCFVTDDKELEVITLPPNGMQTENVTYLPGAYKPYGWVRNQNSTWILKDKNKIGRIKFDYNIPCISYVFNKSINLEYTEIDDKLQKYINQIKFSANYKLGLTDIYKTALSRRPKKLL